ncbi:SAM-dependent methyltransferase [Spirillospora sp. CA-255316]
MSETDGGAPGGTPTGGGASAEGLDLHTDKAHGARIYDYILGGKDHYAPDRAAGEATLQVWPSLRIHMQANRSFMHRVARYLAAEKGIRQFLDIGTGIPTAPNFHDVVQAVAPESRVVYVDNDPIVLAHARALLTSSPEGKTAYIQADMREPESIISAPELLDTLDLSRPIGLSLIAMVHFIEDDDEAYRVVKRIVDVLPSGSYFAAAIATDDFAPEVLGRVQEVYHSHGETLRWRTLAQAEKFFDGLELEEPGVVQIHKWHPDPVDVGRVDDTDIAMYGGIARKP